jgi:hypothetical protein
MDPPPGVRTLQIHQKPRQQPSKIRMTPMPKPPAA